MGVDRQYYQTDQNDLQMKKASEESCDHGSVSFQCGCAIRLRAIDLADKIQQLYRSHLLFKIGYMNENRSDLMMERSFLRMNRNRNQPT